MTTVSKHRRDGGIALGAYAAILAIVTLTGLGALAVALGQPLLFPSIGPTVMVLAERPRSASAHPRNVVVGHAVGVAAGVASLLLFGLWHAPAVTLDGITAARIAAATVSVALTAFVLQTVHAPHAPCSHPRWTPV